MKRLVPVLSAVLCLVLLCSCNKAAYSTVATSTVETTETTAAPTTTTTPDPTPTPSPAQKAKVTDAVRKTYKATNYDYIYKIPEVSIEGMDMTAINAKIKSDVLATQKKNKKGMPKNIKNFGTTYTTFNDGRIISICIASYRRPEDMSYLPVFNIYNISLDTGKLLTPAEFIAMQGLKDSEFFALVKSNGIKTYKSMTYSYIRPFYSRTGKLCLVTIAKNGTQRCYYSATGDMCVIPVEIS